MMNKTIKHWNPFSIIGHSFMLQLEWIKLNMNQYQKSPFHMPIWKIDNNPVAKKYAYLEQTLEVRKCIGIYCFVSSSRMEQNGQHCFLLHSQWTRFQFRRDYCEWSSMHWNPPLKPKSLVIRYWNQCLGAMNKKKVKL